MAEHDPSHTGRVGYRRPPVATRFKTGQSGNPKGRPPNATSQRQIAHKVLGEKQRLAGQPRGSRVWYTTLELITLTVKQFAASGHQTATKLFTRLLDKHGTQSSNGKPVGFLIVPERLTEEE